MKRAATITAVLALTACGGQATTATTTPPPATSTTTSSPGEPPAAADPAVPYARPSGTPVTIPGHRVTVTWGGKATAPAGPCQLVTYTVENTTGIPQHAAQDFQGKPGAPSYYFAMTTNTDPGVDGAPDPENHDPDAPLDWPATIPPHGKVTWRECFLTSDHPQTVALTINDQLTASWVN